eukprot:COSAG05_NODE_5302_length_1211_cov_1.682554_1_plen_55_part_10
MYTEIVEDGVFDGGDIILNAGKKRETKVSGLLSIRAGSSNPDPSKMPTELLRIGP